MVDKKPDKRIEKYEWNKKDLIKTGAFDIEIITIIKRGIRSSDIKPPIEGDNAN